MPVDLSKSHADRRKPSRDVTVGVRQDGMHSREIEMKRNRGEISCAECRRLKIKCDKQIPCQSCQRRGCAALCPNGSLATGQGTRFVIAATEHLHRRITRMSDRIRQLEDALSVLQASHSTEPHPLLRENFSVADSADKPEEQLQEEEEDAPADVVNAFGTMSISDHGVSRFFGPTGGSDLLLLENEDLTGSPSQKTDSSDSSKTYSLPPELKRFSYAFPFTPVGSVEGVIALIRNHLPPWEQALSICESYLENAAWLFRSVSRQQLIHEMLPAIYRKQPAYPPDDYSGPHDLALLFSVFALGSIVDVKLSTPAAEAEGEHYNQLALAALCLQPVLEKPSLVTIQTLHVSSIYNAMSGSEVSSGESSMETTWSLVALAAHLSQTIGLHRDPARWETDPKVVQRRRMVFWDLFIADSWHTLSTGRPPAFNRAYIDCQFPQDEDLPSSLEGGAIASFGVWGFRFSFECVAEVAARTLTATAPRYSTVTELDRKVREFDISPQMLEAIRGGPDVDPRNIPISASMTAFMLSHLREVILMFLHRSFFAQALIEDPENPVRSQYAPSFLATVRSAAKILSDVHEQFAIQPVILSRFWSIWTYAFSSAVVFGSIVTRGPRSHLADSAMAELNGACALFAKASKVNRRAAKAHVILGRLRDKAQRAIAAVRGPAPTPQSDGAAWGIKEEEIEDELAVFAGRTRVFRSAGASHSAPAQTPQASVPIPSSYDDQAHAQAHAAHAQTVLDEWLARQEQYTGYDSHYVARTEEVPASGQYGYAPAQPQYTVDLPSQYAVAPYAYSAPAPPPHSDDLRYATLAPQTELTQLGLAPNSARLNETWMSFMQHSGILDGGQM